MTQRGFALDGRGQVETVVHPLAESEGQLEGARREGQALHEARCIGAEELQDLLSLIAAALLALDLLPERVRDLGHDPVRRHEVAGAFDSFRKHARRGTRSRAPGSTT